MRRLIDKLRGDLAAFVEQRDDLVLVLRVSDDDLAVALKVLRDLEQASEYDLFLVFAHDFDDARPWVDALVAELRAQRDLVDRALVEAGRPRLAPLPPAVTDEAAAPEARLVAALDHARSLVAGDGGNRVVCALAPQRIARRAAWLGLVGAVVPRGGVAPWMRALRVIARDAGVPGEAHPDLSRAPRVRFVETDFGPAALEAAIREDVADERLSDEARMQALVAEASLDYARGRSADAIAKYQHALGHYQRTENLTMQAMVMHGLGDVCRRADMNDQALHWYECAAVPAAGCDVPVVLAVVVRSLGQLMFELGRYDDAAGYFDGLDTLAGRLLDPENKAYALEWKGESQRILGRPRDAITTWEAACTLCRSVGMPEPLRALLTRMQPVYRDVGMPERARAAALEAASLPKGTHAHA